VVQLYLRDPACSVGARPVRELKGFQRVTLKPGETKDVSFTLAAQDLGCWSVDGKWVVEAGRFELVIAPDAASGQMVGFSLDP
jgi:beta-glucosidase